MSVKLQHRSSMKSEVVHVQHAPRRHRLQFQYGACGPSCLQNNLPFHLWLCLLLIFSDIIGGDVKKTPKTLKKYQLLAASVQNYPCWPLTAHTGAILVCNSTPAWHKPAAQTHSSHVHIYCSMPNTSLWLPTLHWPSAVLLHLKSDFTAGFLLCEIRIALVI